MNDCDRMTRRKMLTAIGVVGSAVVSHTMLNGISAVSAESDCLSKLSEGFDTVAELATFNIPIGAVVKTKGCLSIGDGGSAEFDIVAASGSPDGYSRILLVGGNHALIRDAVLNPKQFGANTTASSNTNAFKLGLLAADLLGRSFKAARGQWVLDPAYGTAISAATYNYGDTSLNAAIFIPYRVRFLTDGTETEFLFENLNSTSAGIAIGEDGATGAGFSQQSFLSDGFTVRAVGGTGRYGILAPRNADLFTRKRPKYIFTSNVHFCGSTDDKTVLQTPNEGWDVGALFGDCHRVDIVITGSGTFRASADPSGQHQMTAFKCDAQVGAFGVHPKLIIKSVYRGVDISNCVEGFSIVDSEIYDVYEGVVTTNSAGEPGGFIDNVHVNALRTAYSFSNRPLVHIGIIEAYRSAAYYTDGITPWYAIKVVGSDVDVGHVSAHCGDNFAAESHSALLYADSASCVAIDAYRARSVYNIAILDGATDCKIGDGTINGVDRILDLRNNANDIQCGNVRVRNGSISAYFTNDGTINKKRLNFPDRTNIPILALETIHTLAAGSKTVKPRLTASKLIVNMGAGTGAYTYDLILDHASAIDGDIVNIKITGSSSTNPTVTICNNTTSAIISTFNNIGGSTRLDCTYVFDATSGIWRETIFQSLEGTY